VPAVDAGRIKRLVTDLENEKFEVRRNAFRDLEKLAEQAEAHLRARLAENPPLEVRRRIEPLVQKLDAFVPDQEQVRLLRAIELLERIGTSDAQFVLRELTKGAPEVRLTTDARAALDRLAHRGGNEP